MKQVEGGAQSLVDEFLFTAAEKLVAAGVGRARVAWRRHPPRVERGVRGNGDVQENLLAEQRRPDRRIAFEAVVVERIVRARLGIDVLARRWVAPIFRLRKSPSIGNGSEDISGGRQASRHGI